MAIIQGVTVDYTLSPRVIRIPLPGGVGMAVQVADLQDTLQDIEDNEADGILFPRLRDCSGGESLGGTTTVGYTLKLNNAQIMFECLTTPTSEGTVTTGDQSGKILTDANADFVADGLARGSQITNWTTKATTIVTEVIGPTQLRHVILSGGSRATWDINDTYSAYKVAQCSLGGGNVLAVDGGGAAINPLIQSVNVQAQLEKASSGVLIGQAAVQATLRMIQGLAAKAAVR